MTQTFPVSHLQEAQKLTADSEIDLFTITLVTSPTVYRFKNNNDVTWQGHLYQGQAVTISGDKRSAGDEEGRPVIRINNPLGIYNQAALNGLLDRAIVTKKTVLLQHITSNANIFRQRMWYVERVKELISGQLIGLELRSMTDIPNFKIPVRAYLPPDFPTVSL